MENFVMHLSIYLKTGEVEGKIKRVHMKKKKQGQNINLSYKFV